MKSMPNSNRTPKSKVKPEPEYYSVALIGSSGGGTATLGHTDPVELLTTIHRELLRVRDTDADAEEEEEDGKHRRRRVCVGISHAIFVSLSDGSGFDSIRKKSDWLPNDKGHSTDVGPRAALYSVGFYEHGQAPNGATEQMQRQPFHVTLVDEGPLTKVNRHAQMLDEMLSHNITQCHNSSPPIEVMLSAMISLSSEPKNIHSKSLNACSELGSSNLPIVGSGGTSLSQIASLYDLRIVGNSGGSVASTTLTKARGWAIGLAKEWGMVYDGSISVGSTSSGFGKEGESGGCADKPADPKENQIRQTTPVPTLKSILEAALPSFLFVCITLRSIHTWEDHGSDGQECLLVQPIGIHTSASMVKYTLQDIVLGTTLCILSSTSRSATSVSGASSSSSPSTTNNQSGDQSTLIMSATIAGVLASASATQSVGSSSLFHVEESLGSGSALAGLVAGALIPSVLNKMSYLCHSYHVTATMTNILCGGGVGMLVGVLMHVSGLAHGLGLITGVIRNLLRFRKTALLENDSTVTLMSFSIDRIPSLLSFGLLRLICPILQHFQEQWCHIASIPSLSTLFYEPPNTDCTPLQNLPIPMGLGFLSGCMFVYGSKIGWYHSIFLPLILLEMDASPRYEEASLLGAIDECTLVMVCAGICAGNIILPRRGHASGQNNVSNRGGGHASLAWQALKTNFLCGDFIEAAYPSMERSRIINASAYLAAGLSTEIILQKRVLSTAYLPLPLTIWISNDRWSMSVACSVAFVVSLFGALASNVRY